MGEGLSEEVLVMYLEILRRGISSNVDLLSSVVSYPNLVQELNQIFLHGLVGKKES